MQSIFGSTIRTALAAFLAAIAVSGLVQAAEIKPAIVYDRGGKFDKSFNEAVFNGAQRFSSDTGIKVSEFEPTNEAQIEQAIRKFARRGHSPIIAVGFALANAVEKTAKAFPETQFAIIDTVVPMDNVQSLVFKEHEGSFLVGALAALKSETGTIGFIGGMDIPLIRKFACGYAQGAKFVKPQINVLENMTGSTPSAWNDPTRGGELARSQFARNADVIYAAAGGTGLGVYQTAEDQGKLAIGVDSNQNYLHPGTMLTSMVKRVDVATYNVFSSAMNDRWQSGVFNLGLKESGVDWALDEHNESLIASEDQALIAKLKADIIEGRIEVHDYMSNNSCPG